MLFFIVSGFLCIVRGGSLALWGYGLCLSLLDKVGISDDVFKCLCAISSSLTSQSALQQSGGPSKEGNREASPRSSQPGSLVPFPLELVC